MMMIPTTGSNPIFVVGKMKTNFQELGRNLVLTLLIRLFTTSGSNVLQILFRMSLNPILRTFLPHLYTFINLFTIVLHNCLDT